MASHTHYLLQLECGPKHWCVLPVGALQKFFYLSHCCKLPFECCYSTSYYRFRLGSLYTWQLLNLLMGFVVNYNLY